MNPTRLLLIVFLLAALAGGAWWLAEREPAPTDPDPGPAAPVAEGVGLLAGRIDQLRSVVVHIPDRPTIVRVSRAAGGRWRLEEPWEDRADAAVVGRLLTSLQMSAPAPLREDWAAHSDADLGLDPPQFAVELEMEGGQVHELLVGAPDLAQRYHAARFDGRRLMLGVADVRVFQRMTIQWRDSAVFADPAGVRKIEWLPASGDGFALERSGARWRMTAPEQFLLSPAAEGLVGRLLRARAGVLPEEVVLPGERELIEQADRIVTHHGEQRTTTWISDAVVLPEDRPFLLPVLMDDFQLLWLEREQLRSPFLFDLVPNEIVSLLLEIDGAERRFRRRAQGWFGADSELLPEATQNHLDELVRRVCEIRPERPGRELPSGPPSGRLVLSRSLEPLARSGGELRWWRQERGMPVAAATGTDAATVLDFNLDAGARGVLAD